MKNDRVVTINGKSQRIAQGSPVKTSAPIGSKPLPRKSMDFSRPSRISHFTDRKPIQSTINAVKNTAPQIRKVASDIAAPVRHPMAQRADMAKSQIIAQKEARNTPKPAEQIKREAIEEAINRPVEAPKKVSFINRHKKIVNIFSIGIAAIVVIAYLLYINIPNFSVCIASAQAGISATYPEYKPDGYSLNGPVIYSDGQVIINFKSNTNPTQFVIKQTKSSWDSSAVKNMITKDSNGETVFTAEERGLTIFTYNNNAAWVNGGILYTINGNANLSNDQIRRIATSL